MKVFKDYCGVLTEESIRKNFILIYELVDEMMGKFVKLDKYINMYLFFHINIYT